MSVQARGLAAILLVGVLCPANASAQSASPTSHTEAWLTLSALVSVHPSDDTAVGTPYLDKGLGGVGPGAQAMVEFVGTGGATLILEGSISRLEVFQSGRQIDGRDSGSGGAPSRLSDPLVGVLIGKTVGRRPSTLALAAGAGYVDSVPTINGARVDESGFPSAEEGDGWLALIGGAHARYDPGGRVSFVASARYAFVPRSVRAQEIGASRHIVRVGVGLSIALNR